MHPFLEPGEWLATGRFLDLNGGEAVIAGATIVKAAEDVPTLLQVGVELREVAERSYSQPQTSRYNLEVVGGSNVRFRMDSIALAATLLGGGCFTDRSLIISYQSTDRRFVGFESFTVCDPGGNLVACGSLIADGLVAKNWEVQMDRVPPASQDEA